MRWDVLRDEVLRDPAGVGYSAMADGEVAASLNAPGGGAPLYRDVDVGDLERYLAAEGVLLALRDAASGQTPGSTVARELLALIDSPNVREFNVHHPRAQAGLDVLLSDGTITPAQREGITALGVENRTRAEELGLPRIVAWHIQHVRG